MEKVTRGAKGLGFIVLLAALAGTASLAPVQAAALPLPQIPDDRALRLGVHVPQAAAGATGCTSRRRKTRLPVSMTANAQHGGGGARLPEDADHWTG